MTDDLPQRRGICRSCGTDCPTKAKPLTMLYVCGCSKWTPKVRV
jgi:hypothetical protein